MTALKFVGIIIVAYFCGNLSISRFVARRRNVDIDSTGSGNPGATNMLRNAGIVPALCTLLFDAAKCVLPCLGAFLLFEGSSVWQYGIFRLSTPEIADIAVYTAAIACMLGHMFPVVRKFKGGKGVACGCGLAFFTQPVLAAILFVIYILILIFIRIGSVGSLVAAFCYVTSNTVILLLNKYYGSFGLTLSVLFLIVFAHRKNIDRLIHKKENMLDLQKSAQMDVDYYKSKRKKKDNEEK
ncbi:MAG: glycerol-3-phosphate acyltransferase [Clostridia bacterium]|nr:glycerol-3-phosphate acyltransferase [Clostridia bacterium]